MVHGALTLPLFLREFVDKEMKNFPLSIYSRMLLLFVVCHRTTFYSSEVASRQY